MATLIKIDGTRQEVHPSNKRRGFTLDEVYALLGCSMVQCVAVSNGKQETMIVDEEGKLKEGWPERINSEATAIYDRTYGPGRNLIVGNVLLCSHKEWK